MLTLGNLICARTLILETFKSLVLSRDKRAGKTRTRLRGHARPPRSLDLPREFFVPSCIGKKDDEFDVTTMSPIT